jgi:hypothetical protein
MSELVSDLSAVIAFLFAFTTYILWTADFVVFKNALMSIALMACAIALLRP